MSPLNRLGAVLVVVTAVSTADAGAQSASRPLRQRLTIEFGSHLRTGDLRLTGQSASRSVAFELGRRWTAVPGSTLHLFVEHSPDLDPDRSFLSVTMNYGIVRSLRLDAQNVARSEVVVPIPPQLVRQENVVLFALEQYPRDAGGASSLWTTIGSDSYVQIEGVRAPLRLDLSELPDALIDPRSYVGQTLAVLLPNRPSDLTLEALAILTAHFARTVRPGGVQIQLATSVRTSAPLLIVGTPGEQPQLALLRRPKPTSGMPLADTVGIAGLAAGGGREGQPVLYVTGSSPEAVHRAAVHIVETPVMSGRVARMTEDVARPRRAVRGWKGFLPPRDSFTLADLASADLRISPHADAPLVVALDVPPDARFLNYGHRLNLRLTIEPTHLTPAARLDIAWNGVSIGEYRVVDAFKGTAGSLAISIPARVLRSRNLLELAWIEPGVRASDPAAGWLLRDSDFYLPRYYQAELPDLALLQDHLYPFSLSPDLRDVIVVLPNRLGAGAVAALLELSAALARLAPHDRLAFRVKRAADVTDQDRSQSHLIILHADDSGPQLRSFVRGRQPLLWAQSSGRRPAIQEMISPWNSRRFILILSASSADGLRQAIADGLSGSNLTRLSGDAAYVTADGPIAYTLGPRRTLRESSYRTSLEAWLRTNWLALPVILTVASGLSFAAWRLALRYVSVNVPTVDL